MLGDLQIEDLAGGAEVVVILSEPIAEYDTWPLEEHPNCKSGSC